ncbi:cold-shock protein [Shinella sp.]|uniref:cold-shock protein n=2 Tax=Shinella sp. TaxID=1870904 RepID=UPI004036E741
MSRNVFAIGDAVKLKTDQRRPADSERICRIVAVLPSDRGEVQYRVRVGDEPHERRVLASDIEAQDTPVVTRPKTPASHSGGKEPWFKASSIRTKK